MILDLFNCLRNYELFIAPIGYKNFVFLRYLFLPKANLLSLYLHTALVKLRLQPNMIQLLIFLHQLKFTITLYLCSFCIKKVLLQLIGYISTDVFRMCDKVQSPLCLSNHTLLTMIH